MKKKPPTVDRVPPVPPTGPFASLAALRDKLPPGPPAAATAGGSAGAASAGGGSGSPAPGPARAVVRMERKGRRGKEVTVVEQLGLPAAQLDAWLKALKAALGCGGALEGQALVLQGDHRPRVKELLEARGVRRVTLG
jgi:translation initiation factor 1